VSVGGFVAADDAFDAASLLLGELPLIPIVGLVGIVRAVGCLTREDGLIVGSIGAEALAS
jgi:hypothetical protein